MAFVDTASIQVKAGDGGKGCESHYRDLWMRYPRADGGDGGSGGDIIFIADSHIQTLLDFRFNRHYQAQRGGHGSSKGSTGYTGKDIILRVPVGTFVWDEDTDLLIRDLSVAGDQVIVAKGGRGGIGNKRRRYLLPPTKGQEKAIRLELKLIADVGLIGFPNVGKSTLINAVSRVQSKIASYPFTTKQPILGIVTASSFIQQGGMDFLPYEVRSFVMADLPGLIEGAHLGKGLGHQFLKHAERTKILVHVIDMSGEQQRDPLEDYEKISYELKQYSEDLADKHQILIANKMDLPESQKNLKRFQKKYTENIIQISAQEKQGLDEFILKIFQLLKALDS